MPEDRAAERETMVVRQLAARGITDERVLGAMRAVPRERFLPAEAQRWAYADRAVGIAAEQTISQPWIVAAICQAVLPGPSDRVLEIGTGSGYSAAVLARLAAEVVSVERIPQLAAGARLALAALGIEGVEVVEGDGSVGLPKRAPFDAIAVHAVMPGEPHDLLAQLAPGGRLVAPIAIAGTPGAEPSEYLVRWRREEDGAGFERQTLVACRFVPLIGAAGYPESGFR